MATSTLSRTRRRSVEPEPACLLRWVFTRGGNTITCAVEANAGRSSYDVCILPHWSLSAATVEHFETPSSALRRHAEIARRFRETGWVARYGASRPGSVAA